MIVGKNSANFPPREINHLHVKKKEGYWAALSFHFAPFIRRKSARIMERSGRGDFSNSFAIRKKLVDVTGIEPVTPCLQNTRLGFIPSISIIIKYQRFQQIGESAFRSKLTPMC